MRRSLCYNHSVITRNYHTHTSRCGHASGTDEEYVQAAVRAGLRVLGFSDHAAYRTPMPRERMDISQVSEYIASVSSLKQKYAGKIEIHLGMEVEYYPDQWDTLREYRKNLEYCILGQHNLSIDRDSVYGLCERSQLIRYTDCLEEACRHGLCDYIAHPDVCMWSYPLLDGSVREAARRIAEISVRYQMPLELNCGSGVRHMHSYADGDRYAYPTRIFFEAFAEMKCPVIIGLDVHEPALFLTDKYLNRALSVVSGLDLNILDNYDLTTEAAKRKKLFF